MYTYPFTGHLKILDVPILPITLLIRRQLAEDGLFLPKIGKVGSKNGEHTWTDIQKFIFLCD
jgi:hypothetical protein